MTEGGLREDPRPGPRLWPAGVVLLVLAALGAGWVRYAGRAATRLHLAAGVVVTPTDARLVDGDEGPELRFPGDRVPSVVLRVPVRNASRLPLTVRYDADPGDVPLSDDPHEQSVRVAPGATAWLEIRDDSGGCAGTKASDSGFRYYQSVRVVVRAPAGPARTVALPLPAAVFIPAADPACVRRTS